MNMKNTRTTVSQPPAVRPMRGGFTMVELLVVMFVISMLLAVGVPAALRMRTQAKINACRVTLNTVDTAVDMYRKHYKRTPEADELVGRLIGQWFKDGEEDVVKIVNGKPEDAGDGADYHPGPGFQPQWRGAIHGPWNGVDELSRTGDWEPGADNARLHFIDAFGSPIWYCPFEGSTYTDNEFERTDSEVGVTIASIADYARDSNQKFYRRDYILMSQSANGKWGLIRGVKGDTSSSSNIEPTDDVTNFVQE